MSGMVRFDLFFILLCFLTDTDYLKYLFPQFVKSNLYHLCYTGVGQRISICNYWNGERLHVHAFVLKSLILTFEV